MLRTTVIWCQVVLVWFGTCALLGGRWLTYPGTAGEFVWFLLQGFLLWVLGVVAWRRPGDWTAAITLAFAGINSLAAAGLLAQPGSSTPTFSALGLLLLANCAWSLWPALAIHWGLLFPRPVKLLRRHRIAVLAVLYGLAGVGLAGVVLETAVAHPGLPPGGSSTRSAIARPWALVPLALQAGWLAAVGGSVVTRWWWSRTKVQRAHGQWMLAALGLGVLPSLVGAALVLNESAPGASQSGRALVAGGSLLSALLATTGITRHRVPWLAWVLRRVVVYLAIGLGVSVLYGGLAAVAIAGGATKWSWSSVVLAGLTALVLASVAGWIRDRSQQALERRFLRQKYQLDNAIRRLSRVVDRLVEPAQLARQLLTSAHDAVAAERGAVYLRDKGSERLTQVAGLGGWAFPGQLTLEGALAEELKQQGVVATRPVVAALPTAAQQQLREIDAELALALEIEGTPMGLLLLGPHAGGVPYTAEDRNFLLALARTTSLALSSARGHRTIEALKEKLRETVDKLAEQQQRIRYLQGELSRRRESSAAPAAKGGVPASPGPEHGILGASPPVRALLAQVQKVAGSPSSVLVRGESGTGKELLAQAIHRLSTRAGAPFIAVHCAALSPALLESELFGHVKGAFTGADRDKPGRFELAHGGTLFLDEIGDVSLEVQTKLLRVLQDKAFERVGGVKRIEVDVRLIAATHQNLEELIRQGRFREDLYYRLNVISLRVPPLRERREDVLELAASFLRRYAERAGKTLDRFEPEALDALETFAWPGNIRQLENAVERAVVLAEGETIRPGDLPPELFAAPVMAPAGPALAASRRRARRPRTLEPAWTPGGAAIATEATADDDRQLLEALAACGGNKAEAARLLGLPRSTFFSRLRRAGL